MKNIHNNQGKYRIVKYYNNKYNDFGSYPTPTIAKYIRDKLEENQWQIPFKVTTIFQLEEKYHILHNTTHENDIKANIRYVGSAETYEEAENMANNPLGERYINPQSGGYVVNKRRNKKQFSYGYFTEHQVAYAMRDYLVLCEWELPQHNDEYIIHIRGEYYLLRIEKGNIRCIDHHADRERVTDNDMSNIYKTKYGYCILKHFDKTRENYMGYATLEEAKSMRDFLRKHAWDKEIFREEYNRRYNVLPEYIYRTDDGRYTVRRQYKDCVKVYGRYRTLPEAESRVKYLVEHDWKTDYNMHIVNYDGVFHVYKNIPRGFCTPFRKYYYSTLDKGKAKSVLERFLFEGFPEPYLVTNRCRYILRNRRLFYVFYGGRKMCYGRRLEDVLVARDILEWLGWVGFEEGVYVWDGVEYLVEFNPWGTPVFMRA